MKYWAVGLNFDYEIHTEEPDETEYGSIRGPFNTLKEAKNQIRWWIRTDRDHLSFNLRMINETKASDFKKDKK